MPDLCVANIATLNTDEQALKGFLHFRRSSSSHPLLACMLALASSGPSAFHFAGKSLEAEPYQLAEGWDAKDSMMAASSHNLFPRSPTRSYDSSSVSSATSPRPQSHYLSNIMGPNVRSNPNHTPQPIGIPPLPPVGQSSFQSFTPVTGTTIMGRESLASGDSAVSTPIPSSAQLMANIQKRAYRQRRKDPRYV